MRDLAPAHRPRSSLPLFIAVSFAFIIAYVTLEPFQGWSTPNASLPSRFLKSVSPPRWLPFDWLVNFCVYIPLGFGLAGVLKSGAGAVLLCATASLALESAQYFLPTRVPSLMDWLTNTCGAAFGVWAYAAANRSAGFHRLVVRLRQSWFPGVRGDFGMALLVVFLVAHLSPGLSLFSSSYFLTASGEIDPGLAFLQGAHTALNVIGVGLFADLLVRTRRAAGIMLLGVLFAAIASKTLLAAALLRPGAWGHWLSPPVAVGIAFGVGALLGFFWIPAARKRVLCNVCLIIAILLPLLAPEWLFARVPMRAFDWNYGHLLNFNHLSQTILRLWPLLVSVYLLSTAGNIYQDGQKNPL